jgi:hypothetical protein
MVHALLAVALLMQASAGLRIRTVPDTARVPPNTIVGRGVCGDIAWLLTDWPQLISVSWTRPAVVVRAVTGVKVSDQPWGLACLTDESLWTLINARTLARLTPDGLVRERITLPMPRLELFGWLDRVLFLPLPMPVGRSLLATSPPRQAASTPWPGFLGHDGPSRPTVLARNLVNCGIGYLRALPCWFADERRATISDGATATQVAFPTLEEPDVDPEMPIWDLALAGADTVWLLVGTKGQMGDRKAGGRLVKSDTRGHRHAELRMSGGARLILGATENRCMLLTVDGTLLEVMAP